MAAGAIAAGSVVSHAAARTDVNAYASGRRRSIMEGRSDITTASLLDSFASGGAILYTPSRQGHSSTLHKSRGRMTTFKLILSPAGWSLGQ